jgi:nicotinate-nucleotide adenylyltransferase
VKIGIFGGTFDPPHIGHLIVAQDAWLALGLDQVLFVPAAGPPHKRGRVATEPAVRLALVRAAIVGDPRFGVSDVELRRGGTSYTIDTLRDIGMEYPDSELYLLIGTDQLAEFETWREPAEIRRLARVVEVTRGDVVAGEARKWAYLTVRATRIDVSATEIRRRLAAGEPIRYLVPAAVAELIEREGLYG